MLKKGLCSIIVHALWDDEFSVTLKNAVPDFIGAGRIALILRYGMQSHADVLCLLFTLFTCEIIWYCHFHNVVPP
jgi:hypothetical protein